MLKLDVLKTWPGCIVKQLHNPHVIELLKKNDFMEDVCKDPYIIDILADVDIYAKSEGIVVYHCTKQLPERLFKQTGLRMLNMETHHKEFLDYIRHRVDESVFNRIEKGLIDWRDSEKRHNTIGIRENRIHVCLSKYTVDDSGTEDFYTYFGGEAIYMAFIFNEGMEDVSELLIKLGKPVVVEAKIYIENLCWHRKYFLGRVVVEHFAHSINPNFYVDGGEGIYNKDIPPYDIIAVHAHKKFIESLRVKS